LAGEILDELRVRGIQGARLRLGEYRVRCPECSNTRRKKKDRCLAVRIEDDGATWHCWHCDWAGGFKVKPEGGRVRQDTRYQPRDFGGRSASKAVRCSFRVGSNASPRPCFFATILRAKW